MKPLTDWSAFLCQETRNFDYKSQLFEWKPQFFTPSQMFSTIILIFINDAEVNFWNAKRTFF